MVDINPMAISGSLVSGTAGPKVTVSGVQGATVDAAADVEIEHKAEVSREALASSVEGVEFIVNTISQDISLSFRIEEDLSRMVVTVREVGSDKIIRQFPPEEFITMAKYLAAQNPGVLDEDYLKGVLFDQQI